MERVRRAAWWKLVTTSASCYGRFASKPTYPAMCGRGRAQRAPGSTPRSPLRSLGTHVSLSRNVRPQAHKGLQAPEANCRFKRMDRSVCSPNRPTQEAVFARRSRRQVMHHDGTRAARNAVETRDDVGLVLRSVCEQTDLSCDVWPATRTVSSLSPLAFDLCLALGFWHFRPARSVVETRDDVGLVLRSVCEQTDLSVG